MYDASDSVLRHKYCWKSIDKIVSAEYRIRKAIMANVLSIMIHINHCWYYTTERVRLSTFYGNKKVGTNCQELASADRLKTIANWQIMCYTNKRDGSMRTKQCFHLYKTEYEFLGLA